MAKSKPSQKTQAIRTPRPSVKDRLAVLRTDKREMFIDAADRLAEALADVYGNVSCPPYIRAKIEEFHSAIVSEFNVEPEADIRLRFALAAQMSAMGNRPA
jgi:hypothetical protein